jgi:DNA mismatch repair protein MutL
LYVGLKQDSEFSRGNADFRKRRGDWFLFNDGEVEQTVHSATRIHKKIHRFFYKIGMVIVDQQRAHQRVLYEQF